MFSLLVHVNFRAHKSHFYLVINSVHPTRGQRDSRISAPRVTESRTPFAPFGVAYEKIGTIQRRLAWPLHKDDTLLQSGRPTGLYIYFVRCMQWCQM
ncbi:hypothetical protein PENSPDRAFT_587824 [Peniophora sp. CONT]|nr:hypothetical protein PENSPDRAFT_721391 [Peniophora sp. CONT]KZV64744.1 hypothetical protein PENSPDRAFT_587824 [Peniophora sp. CONT]